MKKVLISIGAVALLAACATRASGVAPIAVSASEYYDLSCDETRAELATAREAENSLSRKQNNAATADTVGVFLVLVPAGSVFGGDVEGELALAKGQVRALERAVETNCTREANAAAEAEAANAEMEAVKAEAAAAIAEAEAAKAEAEAAMAQAEAAIAEAEAAGTPPEESEPANER